MLPSKQLVGFAILVPLVSLLILGINLYNETKESPTDFQKLNGLALYSTRSLELTNYSLLLLDIDTVNRSVVAELYLTFSTESSPFSIFGQSPCDLNSLELISGVSSSKPNIIRSNGETYFQQEFNEEPGSHSIRYRFYWENYLSKVSYSKFRVVVPFNLSYLEGIEETGIDVGSYLPITPDMASESSLSIRLPTESTNIYTMPTPDNVTYYPENIWYIWDLKARSDPKEWSSTAFWMDFESSTLIGQKENDIFLAGVLIASGLSGIISTILYLLGNSLKYSSENANKNRRTSGSHRRSKI